MIKPTQIAAPGIYIGVSPEMCYHLTNVDRQVSKFVVILLLGKMRLRHLTPI